MKYLAFLVLLIAVACSPVVETRSPDVAAATQTARAAAPVSSLSGVLRIRFLTPPPVPTIDNPVVPPTPTVDLVPTVTPEPTACDPVIKGNVSSTGELIFHVPGGASYDQTQIDPARTNAAGVHEQYFCTEQEAIDAGFRKATR